MSRMPLSNHGSNVFQQAMGHRPDLVDEWFRLDAFIRFTGVLDPILKEEVRRNLADGIGCRFCSSLGRPDPTKWDKRTALAVAFANAIFENISDLHGMDDEVFAVAREEFTDPEIVELVCWTLFLVAAQGFGAIMKLRDANDTELTDYQAWRAEGTPGLTIAA
jgi:alkylhydroperoxidase family enzyme